MIELGTPGAHAASLGRLRLRAAALRALLGLAGLGLILAALLLALIHPDTPRLLLVLLPLTGLPAAALGTFQARRSWESAQQGFRGARSERRCARELRRLQPAALVHGALLGAGGDLDHAVLGLPLGGAAAVETKTGGGQLRVEGGRLLAGSRDLTSSLDQARRQAAALSRRLGAPAQPVVVITDVRGQAVSLQGVLVCSLAELLPALRGLRGSCTPERAELLAPQLLAPPR